ncbi:transcriptional regulator [Streptomyces sp. NBC_00654]|uniref:transcriptional regulator n=1 Tax=Streptomyces sp. NBC_00654 TaxID=2975799 RepID=UPI00225150DD|nr:transcriptional regulator [Streptomyces sp. NBC_00654]MCX4967525.1 transcriptional regulator [Streptomyces sp. NBC_00654]
MSTPTGFDELIHPSTRLSVVALLAATEWADFAFIRDSLSLSDSELSKQLHTLGEAGYLEIHKEGGGRKRRTKVRLTDRGRTAFDACAGSAGGLCLPAEVDGAGAALGTAAGRRAGRRAGRFVGTPHSRPRADRLGRPRVSSRDSAAAPRRPA